MTELEKQLMAALKELVIDMKIAQGNMRIAAIRDPKWEGCAEAIQPRVDAAEAAIAAAEAAQPVVKCATCQDSGVVGHSSICPNCEDTWQPASAQPVAVLPKYDCFSNDEGDSWLYHPADAEFVDGLKLGDEFELLAGWTAERVTFRVTKVPDEESDDYEVEQVTPQQADVLRGASQLLVDALEKLARLGAGDRYGNSDGNVIAQQALAEFRAMLSAAKNPESGE